MAGIEAVTVDVRVESTNPADKMPRPGLARQMTTNAMSLRGILDDNSSALDKSIQERHGGGGHQ